MKNKKDKVRDAEEVKDSSAVEEITTKQELKVFLTTVRDALIKDAAPPVVASAALNHALTINGVYDLFDKETKEIAQEIWVKLSQTGMQIRRPAFLFGEIDSAAAV